MRDHDGNSTKKAARSRSTRLVEIALAGRTLRLEMPESPDDLVRDAEDRGRASDAYWAHLWPAATMLARHLATSVLVGPGVRVVELGCGIALAGFACSLRGADVLVTDAARGAVDLARANARRNGLGCAARTLDWSRPLPPDLAKPDLVIASDILYDRRDHAHVARVLAVMGAPAIIADPDRPCATDALRVFEEHALRAWQARAPGGRLIMVQPDGADGPSVTPPRA